MAMKVPPVNPYSSQNSISFTSDTPALGPRADASDFLTPGQRALPGAINQTGHTLLGLAAGAYFSPQPPQPSEEDAERTRRQDLTDIVADSVEYENAQKSFEDEYKNSHQGAEARNAVKDFQAFHQSYGAQLQEKWRGNADRQHKAASMSRMYRDIALVRATQFRDEQEKARQRSVAESVWENARAAATDSSLSFGEKLGMLHRAELSLRLTAGQELNQNTGKWEGGENIDDELTRRRQSFHERCVDGLIAQGKPKEARGYLWDHAEHFKETGLRLLVTLKTMEKVQTVAEREAKEETERKAKEDALMGRYAQMQTAMKVVSDLDKQEGTLYWLIAAEPDEKDRDTLIARAEKDFKQLRRGRDADDMRAFGAARTALHTLMPSEKEDWLRKNWSGSKQGHERALAELTGPTGALKAESPTDKRVVQTLVHVLRNKQLTDVSLAGATMWQLQLSERQFDTLTRLSEGDDTEAEIEAAAAAAEDPAFLADAEAFIEAINNGTVGEWKAALDAAERGETGVLVAANGPLDGLLSGDGKKEE